MDCLMGIGHFFMPKAFQEEKDDGCTLHAAQKELDEYSGMLDTDQDMVKLAQVTIARHMHQMSQGLGFIRGN